ncbi:hypothetical protein [Vagococcus fluvialis]|uniref:hypothetical protein n=1 Tax=Vagococcus fluvialis TaxID=2738 RepID=UPI003B5C5111
MIFNKKNSYLILSLLALTTLSACGNNSNNSEDTGTADTVHKVKESSEQTEKKQEPLDILNQLATMSKSTEELYVTGDLTIGSEQEIKPGIYDLEITGGSGNISGERANVPLFINWVGGAKGSGDYASKIRILLFEGDILKFRNISKIKLNAIPEKVEPTNELGIGEFVVGRDITAGDYKLSTNAKLNPEYENLGWSTRIYNDSDGQSREQQLTGTNNDVAVSLKDGEVISISYDNTDYGSSSDDAKLIFTKL